MKDLVEPGTTVAPEKFQIVIAEQGPYLVYGSPPLRQWFIMPNADKEIWYYKAGASYPTQDNPTALCRCGASRNKPYCDGSHTDADWDPTLRASEDPILSGAEVFEGPKVSISDNQHYCVFARFCDAKGRVWNRVYDDSDEATEVVVHEANRCPGARLSAWKNPDTPEEPHFEPSLGLIEDPTIRCSSALWVRGGIPVRKENGFTYEIRNRVALCRCGQSSNKPYCDGTHASMKFRDGLPNRPDPDGEEF